MALNSIKACLQLWKCTECYRKENLSFDAFEVQTNIKIKMSASEKCNNIY